MTFLLTIIWRNNRGRLATACNIVMKINGRGYPFEAHDLFMENFRMKRRPREGPNTHGLYLFCTESIISKGGLS